MIADSVYNESQIRIEVQMKGDKDVEARYFLYVSVSNLQLHGIESESC